MPEFAGVCAYCQGGIGTGEPVVAWIEEGRFVLAHRFRQTCEGVVEDDRKFLAAVGIAVVDPPVAVVLDSAGRLLGKAGEAVE